MNNQEMMELSTVDKSDFEELVKECTASGIIDQNLYTEYDVKRGLRDSNGNGVLTGLTEISDVLGNQSVHGRKIPVDGEVRRIWPGGLKTGGWNGEKGRV